MRQRAQSRVGGKGRLGQDRGLGPEAELLGARLSAKDEYG